MRRNFLNASCIELFAERKRLSSAGCDVLPSDDMFVCRAVVCVDVFLWQMRQIVVKNRLVTSAVDAEQTAWCRPRVHVDSCNYLLWVAAVRRPDSREVFIGGRAPVILGFAADVEAASKERPAAFSAAETRACCCCCRRCEGSGDVTTSTLDC